MNAFLLFINDFYRAPEPQLQRKKADYLGFFPCLLSASPAMRCIVTEGPFLDIVGEGFFCCAFEKFFLPYTFFAALLLDCDFSICFVFNSDFSTPFPSKKTSESASAFSSFVSSLSAVVCEPRSDLSSEIFFLKI